MIRLSGCKIVLAMDCTLWPFCAEYATRPFDLIRTDKSQQFVHKTKKKLNMFLSNDCEISLATRGSNIKLSLSLLESQYPEFNFSSMIFSNSQHKLQHLSCLISHKDQKFGFFDSDMTTLSKIKNVYGERAHVFHSSELHEIAMYEYTKENEYEQL